MEFTIRGKRKKMSIGQDDNALTWLVILIAVVFVIINSVKIVMFLTTDNVPAALVDFRTNVLTYFTLPADLHMLAQRPWTVFTYMFTHESVLHVLSSLLWLWAFGFILQDLSGNRHLFPLFLYGGLAGAVIFLISVNAIHNFSQGNMLPMIGSGSSVMAVAIATTTLSPNYRIFPLINGGIPLWVIAVVFIGIDYATIATINGSYALAHLGGGVFGFLYAARLRSGHDWGAWMHGLFNWANDLFNPEKKLPRGGIKEERFYKSDKEPYSVIPRLTQDRIDMLLDKINMSGYDSLTEAEKDFLKKAGEDS